MITVAHLAAVVAGTARPRTASELCLADAAVRGHMTHTSPRGTTRHQFADAISGEFVTEGKPQ